MAITLSAAKREVAPPSKRLSTLVEQRRVFGLANHREDRRHRPRLWILSKVPDTANCHRKVNLFGADRLRPAAPPHLTLSQIRRQCRFTAPPIEDLRLDYWGALIGHHDGAQHLPTTGTCFFRRLPDESVIPILARPEAGVRD
jgi:hypothetical protein